MAEEVLTSREGGVLIITMNRPDARNAVDSRLAEGLAAAADELDADRSLSVGVLTGAGGTFCSGMDLKAFLKGEVPTVGDRGFGGITRRGPAKPLIAAVEGYALAGGCEIALACDLIVASREAKFGLPEVKRALVAGAGGLFRLPERIPRNIAMEYALTGEFFTAEQAHGWGLVNRVTEPGGALAAALELAGAIAQNGPLAITATKKIVNEAPGWPAEQRWQRQGEIMDPIFASADAREGAAAFAEKRKPVWKGE
ncbi:short chain enoyl-CoA hydratase [Pseudonocardia thermophila]|jgi:Enoyl-CoA hydratase/carnithine racemase|uniref:Short chain enoyl-CoA hydratase n=1 Tax=Pseudonocardia thermophila TaxID=1848 RepID=A0A1M7B3M7_PSETH|nr:crotonase/enoyl-CoA hydratase family protein [Pseudonocardia thermophila]SHL49570.1 short chain enoyl-CoA hydratase [Pseudonocardia thermophila]